MKFSSTYLDWLKSEITEEDLETACTEYLTICIQLLT